MVSGFVIGNITLPHLLNRGDTDKAFMELGLYIRSMATFPAMLEVSRYAEELGLYGVFLNDHFEGLSGDRREPYLEAWTALTGIGVATKKIRVGHITLFNSMRNPAVLAKMISTLDVMIGGRYEAIIGAGWNEPEYRGYDLMEGGRGMPEAGERVTRLKEAVQIMRGMFDNEVFSYEGRYWRLHEAVNVPQPMQNPMRISVGARQPRMIGIAARYAEGMNGSGGMHSIRSHAEVLEHKLESLGKRLKDFWLHGFAMITLTGSQAEADRIIRKIAKGRPVKEVADDAFVGTADMLIEKLRECKDRGYKMMIAIPTSGEVEQINRMSADLRDKVFSQV